MRLVLYQPDMPGNLGAVMRLTACFGIRCEVILPCGFPLTAKALRRAAMDYGGKDDVVQHDSFEAFLNTTRRARIILATTRGAVPLTEFKFLKDDILLMGRESAGVPDCVHAASDAGVLIPMASGARSLNLASSAAVMSFEALRQTGKLEVGGRK